MENLGLEPEEAKAGILGSDNEQGLDDQTWDLAGHLVGIDSSDPGAYEGRIEGWIKEWLIQKIQTTGGSMAGQIGLKEKEVLPGRFNLMARIPGKSGKPGLTYICHMDTVMLGDGWNKDTPALGAVVSQADGAKRLYGLRYEIRACMRPGRFCPGSGTGGEGGAASGQDLYLHWNR